MSDAVSRYSVGIDLGTTHCVLSYLPLGEEGATPKIFPIQQLSRPGAVEALPQLPSFSYQPHEAEINSEACVLPWSSSSASLTGTIARTLGSKTPIRLVALSLIHI